MVYIGHVTTLFSCRRRMQQKHSYVPPGEGGDTRGNEFTLDPDSVREDTDGGGASELTTPTDTHPLLNGKSLLN